MKPFLVEITTVAVVIADDEVHAESVAVDLKRDICGEDPSPSISVDTTALTLASLPHGWDGECLPYGGDGNTRLKDLLPGSALQNGPTMVNIDEELRLRKTMIVLLDILRRWEPDNSSDADRAEILQAMYQCGILTPPVFDAFIAAPKVETPC